MGAVVPRTRATGVGFALRPLRAACSKNAAACTKSQSLAIYCLCVVRSEYKNFDGSSVWLLTNCRRPSCFVQGLLIYSSQKACVFSTEAPERELPRRTHSLRAGDRGAFRGKAPGRRSHLCRVYSKPAVTVLHLEGKSPLRPRTHTPEKQHYV